ncbi:MAG: hypothetical protein IPG72_07330 [Ardenticatenales bacterium]|jgi:carboxyl-terminal processing protease|nr:hypothetical protein [Ardenticatenales bacterium]
MNTENAQPEGLHEASLAAPTPRPRRRGAIMQFVVGFGLIVAAWLFGVVARVAQRQLPPLPPSDVVPPAQFEQLYGEAWDYVNSEFYGDRPAPAAITDGAVEGMVEALDDPWALVATPAAGAGRVGSNDGADGTGPAADDPLSPAFIGPLGLWIVETSRGARVLAIVPDGVAAEAGIEAGDLIVRAENGPGTDSAPTPTPAATEAAAADGHDPVTSGDRLPPVSIVLADGSMPDVEVVVARDDTSIFARALTRSAENAGPRGPVAEFDGDVLRIRLAHLMPGAAEDLAALLARAEQRAPSSVILDLRDNPGGSRSELALVAGRFMSGTVWIERARDNEAPIEHSAEAPSDGPSFTDADLVVVVNGGTGDEAEMLAAALREARGARLVGEPTFGHGTLQTLREIGRLQLRLTTGTWQSPGGADIAETGIAPDVVVEGRAEQDAAALTLTTAASKAQAADGGG